MKRFQNISTVTTSIMKKSANGEFKNMTVRPGMVVRLSEDDIDITKDGYNPRESNPFDKKFIAEIPEGKATHPNAPNLKKNPTHKAAQDAVKEGVAAVKKMVSDIVDYRGIVIMNRALLSEEESVSQSQKNEMNRLIDSQRDKVERIQDANAQKFGSKV